MYQALAKKYFMETNTFSEKKTEIKIHAKWIKRAMLIGCKKNALSIFLPLIKSNKTVTPINKTVMNSEGKSVEKPPPTSMAVLIGMVKKSK